MLRRRSARRHRVASSSRHLFYWYYYIPEWTHECWHGLQGDFGRWGVRPIAEGQRFLMLAAGGGVHSDIAFICQDRRRLA